MCPYGSDAGHRWPHLSHVWNFWKGECDREEAHSPKEGAVPWPFKWGRLGLT